MDEEIEILPAADENEDNSSGDEEDEEEEEEDDEEDLSSPFIAAAKAGDLTTMQSLLKHGAVVNEATNLGKTAIWHAARNDNLGIVQLLVEQGADMEKCDRYERSPLFIACCYGHLEVARYLLEQGANREKVSVCGWTPLHVAADNGHLNTAKLLMVYGADLNARDNNGDLPIDTHGATEEIKQIIRDEPRRRMDHGHKRATEQDRHPNAATSASGLQEDEEDEGVPSNKKQRLDEGTEVEEGKVAEEDEDSEPSCVGFQVYLKSFY